MVLHLLPNGRRFDDGRDVQRRKLARATDATQEKQLRRIDSTSRKDDFLVSMYSVVGACESSALHV